MGLRGRPKRRWQAVGVAGLLVAGGALWHATGASAALPAAQDCTASWYGATDEGVENWPTAGGSPFHAADLTAASRTLPFGTKVKVTDPASGRSVTVEITDRGPFTDPAHRCIDLSAGAFHSLGLDLCDGLTDVRVEPVAASTPRSTLAAGFRPISMAECVGKPPGPKPTPTSEPKPTPTSAPTPTAKPKPTRSPSSTPSPSPTPTTRRPSPSASPTAEWWMNHDAAWWTDLWNRQLAEMVAEQQKMIDQQNATARGGS